MVEECKGNGTPPDLTLHQPTSNHQAGAYLDKGGVVHVAEEAHEELAVHSIGDAAVARYGLAKVFQFERPLEAAREESTKRRDDGRETGHEQRVPLDRCQVEILDVPVELCVCGWVGGWLGYEEVEETERG